MVLSESLDVRSEAVSPCRVRTCFFRSLRMAPFRPVVPTRMPRASARNTAMIETRW